MNWLNRFKNLSIYGLGQSVNLISPLLVTPYIVSISGEAGLGKVGICLSICLILMGVLDYSSYLQGTKIIAVNRDNQALLSKTISSIYGYKILLFLVLILPILLIPIFVFPNYRLVFILSTSLLLGHILNPNWILYGLERYKQTAIYNIASKVFYLTMVFLLLQHEEDYIWVNFLNGLGNILVYSYAFYVLYKEFNLKLNKAAFQRGIQTLKADYKLSLSEFCLSLYQFLPIVVVGAFTGAYSAGIYRIIEQIFSVLRTFIFMFFNFSYPTVCADLKEYLTKGLKLWLQYHVLNFLIISFVCIGIAIFSTDVLSYFNVNAEDMSYVRELLYIALLLPLVSVLSQALRQLMLALDLMKWYSNIVYIFTASNVIIMLILVPMLQIKGALYSMLICEVIAITLYLVYIKKQKMKLI